MAGTQDDEIRTALEQFVAETPILSESGRYMRSAYDNHPLALDVWHAKEALRKLNGAT